MTATKIWKVEILIGEVDVGKTYAEALLMPGQEVTLTRPMSPGTTPKTVTAPRSGTSWRWPGRLTSLSHHAHAASETSTTTHESVRLVRWSPRPTMRA